MEKKLKDYYKTISNSLNAHWKDIEDKYHVILLAVQGSQNYDLAYENSDIDTKAYIIPSFYDFVLNQRGVNYTYVRENNEHIDIKDIRLYFNLFWKQNINFLEVLFTPYVICRPSFYIYWKQITELREEIARYDEARAVSCMKGMALEKFKALEHSYPSTKDVIERYGYCGKELHHILRMEEFMRAYISGESFSKCLVSYPKYGRELLLKAKRNEFSLSEARELANESIRLIGEMKEDFLVSHNCIVNNEVREKVEEILIEILKFYFKEELGEK